MKQKEAVSKLIFAFFLKAKVGFEVRYSNVILLNTAFIAYYYGKMKEDVLFRDILFSFAVIYFTTFNASSTAFSVGSTDMACPTPFFIQICGTMRPCVYMRCISSAMFFPFICCST